MSAEIKRDAKRLAAKGRRGDKNLLHITDEELLALYASGKITRNPKTGLPEAFNLGDFLSNPFDPGGLVSGAIGRYDPIGSAALEATDWAPGSAGSLYAAMKQEDAGNPFGAEASAFDIFAGGTSESQDPDKRRIGRTVGSLFAGYGLGEAFGGAAGAGAGGAADAESAGLASNIGGTSGLGGEAARFSMPAAVPELAAANAAPGEVTAFSGMDNAVTQGAAGTSGFTDFGGGTPGADSGVFSNDLFQGTDLQGAFGGEAGPGGPGGATFGAEPAGQSYYQQFLDWMKKRGMLKTGMQGLNAISGIYGMNKARQLEKLAQAASPMRTQAVSDAAALQADPSRVTSLPGYKAGLQAVERRMASQGYLGSGNMMVALRDYGGKQYDTELARLTALAQPSATELQGTIAANQMRNQSLKSLGYAAMGLFS